MSTIETNNSHIDQPQNAVGHARPKATSAKQVAANRQNAQHSTGPKTPEGKAAVAQNAVKHGLRALSGRNVVIPGEDPDEFQGFHDELLDGLEPTNAAEWVLAERIVVAQWRLRRAARYEGQLMEDALASIKKRDAHHAKYHPNDTIDPDQQAAQELPRAVNLCLSGKAHWQMVRYEGYLQRGMFRALKELQELQKDPAPADPVDERLAARIEAELAEFQREQAEVEAALQELQGRDAAPQADMPHDAPAPQGEFAPADWTDAFTSPGPADTAGAKQSHFTDESAQVVAEKDPATPGAADGLRDRPARERPDTGKAAEKGTQVSGRPPAATR